MSLVRIALADLIQLSRHAQHAGTQAQFIALSLEWAARAQAEINQLQTELREIKRSWIEPKPVTPPSPAQGSRSRWPFQAAHDHEAQIVTGLSIPETPT